MQIWICTQVFCALWLCRSRSRSSLLFQQYTLLKIPVKLFTKDNEKCLSLLTQSQFRVRAIISDNHTTNVNAYNILLTNYRCQGKNYKITNPYLSHQNYLLFDTCHLIKNIRNNLLSKSFLIFQLLNLLLLTSTFHFLRDLFSGLIFTLFMKET